MTTTTTTPTMIVKAKAKVVTYHNKPAVLLEGTYFFVGIDIPIGTTGIFIAHKHDQFAYIKQ
jgi:hypothetical protein